MDVWVGAGGDEVFVWSFVRIRVYCINEVFVYMCTLL